MAIPSSIDGAGTVPPDLSRRVVQFGRHVQNLPPGRHVIELEINKPGDLHWKIGLLTSAPDEPIIPSSSQDSHQ